MLDCLTFELSLKEALEKNTVGVLHHQGNSQKKKEGAKIHSSVSLNPILERVWRKFLSYDLDNNTLKKKILYQNSWLNLEKLPVGTAWCKLIDTILCDII